MTAVIVYPAAYHGKTRVEHTEPKVERVQIVGPLQELRDASLHMEQALGQVRDVVDRLNVEQMHAGEQAACLGYLSGSLRDRMGDLRRETESFVSFLRG